MPRGWGDIISQTRGVSPIPMLKWTTPVPKDVPHAYVCTGCGNRRTLRLRDWLVLLYCDICRRKINHTRQD